MTEEISNILNNSMHAAIVCKSLSEINTDLLSKTLSCDLSNIRPDQLRGFHELKFILFCASQYQRSFASQCQNVVIIPPNLPPA